MTKHLLDQDGVSRLVTNADVTRNVSKKLETNNSRDTRQLHSEQLGMSAIVTKRVFDLVRGINGMLIKLRKLRIVVVNR